MTEPMLFQIKCISVGASRDCVYSSTAVIRRLIVTTFKTGTSPASNAPACRKVNSAVVAAAGEYLEAVKINCGHDTVITNNLFIDTRCVFNAYIDSRFATGMTSDDGYGIAPSLRQVWNNELYTSRWPWMAAARDGTTGFYIPNTFSGNILIYTDSSPRGSDKQAYAKFFHVLLFLFKLRNCFRGRDFTAAKLPAA